MDKIRSASVFLINQNVSLSAVCDHININTHNKVIILSTHNLFPHEKNNFISYDNVSFFTFSDFINDAVAADCDQKASAYVDSYLAGGGSRVNAMTVFSNYMTRYKNHFIHYFLNERITDPQFFYATGLGVDGEYWAGQGGAPLPMIQSKGEGESAEGVSDNLELTLASHEESGYIFLTPINRLVINPNATVKKYIFSDFFKIIQGKSGGDLKELILNAVRHIFSKNCNLIISTTIHGYKSWHAEISDNIHVFVDGYHPPNYSKSYIDIYDLKSTIICRDPISLNWFWKYGMTVIFGDPILQKIAMKPPVRLSKGRRLCVLFALNHAGDWSALINRCDTDRLVLAAAQLAKQLPAVDFVIRMHPTMDHPAHEGKNSKKRIADFIHSAELSNISISTQSLDQDLSWSEVVVSEYSQVIIDAMIEGKIGIIANLTGRRSFMAPYEDLGFHKAGSIQELEDVISSISNGDDGVVAKQSAASERYNRLVGAVAQGCPACKSPVVQEIGRQKEFSGAAVYECRHCGHGFAFPMPDDATIAQYYGDQYSIDRRRHVSREYVDLMLQRAQSQVNFVRNTIARTTRSDDDTPVSNIFLGKHVLDIGCGIGALVAVFQASGANAVGFDSDEYMIGIARSIFSASVTPASFNEIESIESKNIFCLSHALEHFADPAKILRDLLKKTLDGGYIFIEVPNHNKSMFDEDLDTEGHLHFFTPASLQKIVMDAGWAVMSITTCGPTIPEMIEDSKRGGSASVYNGIFERYSENEGFWIRCLAQAPIMGHNWNETLKFGHLARAEGRRPMQSRQGDVSKPQGSGVRETEKAPTRYFCTYFDSAYAPRGLAMIASILRFMPNARFYILCLDDTAHRIVSERQPAARAVRLAELEDFDPDLAGVKSRRTLIEYYFTCTPCLPRFVLAKEPAADMVTYLDADLFFYRSPEEVFAAIGDASVAITPHRFSQACAERERYGRYNVSWVSWRNDAEGRRCLEDYRTDCLAWCHDRLEGDRFADQKYLDAWPVRYRGVRDLDGKGVNLALWNVESHSLSQHGDVILVDDEPLIFYHFHGVKHIGPSVWDIRLREYGVTRNATFLTEAVYKPYLTLLENAFNTLAGPYGLAIPGDRRFGKERNQSAAAVPISDGYAVIDRATAAALADGDSAWSHADVSERQDAAYDGLLAEMRQGRPRIDLAVAAAAVKAAGLDAPSVLEVGCASGYYQDVFAYLLGGAARYAGVDRSPALIDLARRRRPDASFQVADAVRLPFEDASVDIVFNGVALMHIVDYEAAIAESRRVTRRFCVFHTVPVLSRRPTTFLRKAAYGRPVAEVILNEAELRLLFARHGLAVRRMWESIPYNLETVLGEATPTRTYLCEATSPISPTRPALLNIGCGSHFHDDWVNVDIAPQAPGVLAWNILEPLPFADASFDVVYHSHVLEHLPKRQAPGFLAECRRLLKPGGILRVVVPDLERIARLYVDLLDRAEEGDPAAADRYDWMLLELFDQMVRNESGGEMLRFLQRSPVPAEDFVIERVGREAQTIIDRLRRGGLGADGPHTTPTAEAIGRFRLSGEVHQWMYDRFSLRRLLEEAGFRGARVATVADSAIPAFQAYGLDAESDGRLRKPDSLYMEAWKAEP